MTSVDALLALNEPLWDEEALVCRRYFASPERTVESDLRWIARQAAKELFDGVLARAAGLSTMSDLRDVVALTEELHEEAVHLAAFVGAFEQLRPDDVPPLDRATLESWVAWPGNVELRAMRARHRRDHGRLGELAGYITEGGRAALFVEGAALAGNGGADDVIAAACAAVHADEVDHMRAALDAITDLALDHDELTLLGDLTAAQSRQRIRMRVEQFGA